MKLFKTILIVIIFVFNSSFGQTEDIETLPLPKHLQDGTVWEFQTDFSDDFNYTYLPQNKKTKFGDKKWINFYQSKWDGPGTTYWKYNHVAVDGNDLIIKASRWKGKNEAEPKALKFNKMNKPNGGISAGCITSTKTVVYPVFIESKSSVANIVLASDVWLLSPDATQEIDIMECYGGKEPGNSYFAKSIHISHHSFIRKPFTDYQPRDKGAWYNRDGVSGWGEYCWNNGDRKYVRTAVYWKSPVHFEHYIDGELVRVLYDKALVTKVNGKWQYGYPTMTNGKLDVEYGKQKITSFSTLDTYSFEELKKTSNTSSVSIIDPYEYQGGKGFTKPLNIIINLESQDWHVKADRTPTDADLNNPDKNTMKVDWFRVFKPVH
ncbi:LamG domain-containing protein [Seonamhaeicola maritimus]|uniref:Beta-agarase n=1 Tax=Seonamhaeicola maritimus TaxID=2591822 RepID=A0A5C7GEW6_9FLAO|nr:beta-agarase [Seonamhaeicola maritimus]TXG35620.1 beta-agarase [Seonamhaeicola maritimus]